ncbi:MAG: hypothetical protein ABH852_04095 [Methanobacteriota archaeon]
MLLSKVIEGEKTARIGISAMIGIAIVLVIAGTGIFIMASKGTPERAKIGDIIGDPSGYAGRVVIIDCKYGGWIYGGDIPVTNMGSQVTKSDWCVYDETGGIYVQAGGGAEILESGYSGTLVPTDENCIGADLVIRGTVRISDEGVPYIG